MSAPKEQQGHKLAHYQITSRPHSQRDLSPCPPSSKVSPGSSTVKFPSFPFLYCTLGRKPLSTAHPTGMRIKLHLGSKLSAYISCLEFLCMRDRVFTHTHFYRHNRACKQLLYDFDHIQILLTTRSSVRVNLALSLFDIAPTYKIWAVCLFVS